MDRHALFVAAVGTFLIVASLQARAEQKADWPTYGMDSLRSGYNPCEKILGAITVGRLSQTWGFDTGAFEVAKIRRLTRRMTAYRARRSSPTMWSSVEHITTFCRSGTTTVTFTPLMPIARTREAPFFGTARWAQGSYQTAIKWWE